MTDLNHSSVPFVLSKAQSAPLGLERIEDYAALESKRCNIGRGATAGDENPTVVVANRKLLHFTFEDFAAREVTFEDCDFSYYVFTRAYFYKAKFINCRFIGCVSLTVVLEAPDLLTGV
jgi:hypothetical protein